MLRLSIILREKDEHTDFCLGLAHNGLAYSVMSYDDDLTEALENERPNVLLVEIGRQTPGTELLETIEAFKKKRRLPVIALVPAGMLNEIDDEPVYDDFITGPYVARELILRLNRLLRSNKGVDSSELIACGGLMINLATCEVAVDGRPVELTFKEYELLKLMASNRGRVFTREALLDKIWGYDYYGGDRTVDVHVRRLRSKIENAANTFIETVRNIGYRFKS